jgi:phosphatidylglycerophosphate synthase
LEARSPLGYITGTNFSLCHAPNNVSSIGASVWIYSSLDAIDGKQARRTGETGPLGELFDHGCDAVNLSVNFMFLIFRFMFS